MDRQSHAGDPEPAAGRRLGAAVTRAVSAALSRHYRVLLHRRLHHQQQAVRCLCHGLLRDLRLRRAQARMRAGATRARLRPRADDGGEPAPRIVDLAWRSHGVPAGADQPDLPADRCRLADGARGARCPRQARGSAAGVDGRGCRLGRALCETQHRAGTTMRAIAYSGP